MDKLDYSFKKLSNRLFTNRTRLLGSEKPKLGNIQHSQNILLQNIPLIPVNNEIIKLYDKQEMVKPNFLNDEDNCLAIIEENDYADFFISPMYGSSYDCQFWCSLSGGTKFESYYQILKTDLSGWLFDYETGLITYDRTPDFKIFDVFSDYEGLTNPEYIEYFEEEFGCTLANVEINKYYLTAYRYIGKNMDEQVIYNDSLGELHIYPTKLVV